MACISLNRASSLKFRLLLPVCNWVAGFCEASFSERSIEELNLNFLLDVACYLVPIASIEILRLIFFCFCYLTLLKAGDFYIIGWL